MLNYFMDAHADKLRTIPLRTKFDLINFDGSTLYDLVEYGASLHEYACTVCALPVFDLSVVNGHSPRCARTE